jgi:hypothetical protein
VEGASEALPPRGRAAAASRVSGDPCEGEGVRCGVRPGGLRHLACMQNGVVAVKGAKWVGDSAACARRGANLDNFRPYFRQGSLLAWKVDFRFRRAHRDRDQRQKANRTSLSTRYWTDDTPFIPSVHVPSTMSVEGTSNITLSNAQFLTLEQLRGRLNVLCKYAPGVHNKPKHTQAGTM